MFNFIRIQRYKVWQKCGIPVLAIDYRGYADSTRVGRITEVSIDNICLINPFFQTEIF